jgi:hypothetical protein
VLVIKDCDLLEYVDEIDVDKKCGNFPRVDEK